MQNGQHAKADALGNPINSKEFEQAWKLTSSAHFQAELFLGSLGVFGCNFIAFHITCSVPMPEKPNAAAMNTDTLHSLEQLHKLLQWG